MNPEFSNTHNSNASYRRILPKRLLPLNIHLNRIKLYDRVTHSLDSIQNITKNNSESLPKLDKSKNTKRKVLSIMN